MNKILIEPMVNGKEHGLAIQAVGFMLGLKVSNISSKPSSEFTISNICLMSAQGQDITNDCDGKSFFVEILNPGESKIIEIGKNGGFMYGLITIKAMIVPKESSVAIEINQKNSATKEISTLNQKNSYVDFLYIKSSSEYAQERLIKWTTWLTFVIAFLTLVQVILLFKK